MPTNILMPALSPTMEKGNLAKWLKKEGDVVKSGDVIAEIETDKATMEVEAVDDGTIAKIVVPEGTQDVAVNAVIAVLAADGEDPKAAGAAETERTDKQAEAKNEKPAKDGAEPLPEGERSAAKQPGERASSSNEDGASPQPSPQREEGADRTSAQPQQSINNRVFASPLARRLAKDAGIDVAQIAGTGPHGRVIARDVEQARSGKSLKPAAAGGPVAGAPSAATGLSDKQVLGMFAEGSYESVPHSTMRKVIAQRLLQSTQSIPHFYLTMDCDIGRLVAAREEINALAPKGRDSKPAYKLSVNDFIIKALALALQRVPDANVSWTEGAMLKHKTSDVGVAVAMPGGLITPVIRNAHTKSVSAISIEMKDLAARARDRKLKPEEYQGGTTAVSNLGMYGIKDFTAVINPPHATILAVGAAEERAVVRGGRIEVATIMSVTMSCDHRAVDGALGAELLGAFRLLIENPLMMVV